MAWPGFFWLLSLVLTVSKVFPCISLWACGKFIRRSFLPIFKIADWRKRVDVSFCSLATCSFFHLTPLDIFFLFLLINAFLSSFTSTSKWVLDIVDHFDHGVLYCFSHSFLYLRSVRTTLDLDLSLPPPFRLQLLLLLYIIRSISHWASLGQKQFSFPTQKTFFFVV